MASSQVTASPPVSRRRQLAADGTLIAVTFVWGSTFVMVKDIVEQVSPMLFLAARFALGALALAILLTVLGKWRGLNRRELVWGGLIGVTLWAGYALQTIGLQYTTATNAGFITGMSVVLVPVLGIVILRQIPGVWAWLGVGLAATGLAMLTLTQEHGLSFNQGDLLVLGCALAFAFQIVLIARFAPTTDPLRLTLVQILVAGLLNGISAALFEPAVASLSSNVWAGAAFLGVVATAVAIGVQVSVQRFTTAVHAALIFTLEPVFAAVFGIWLHDDRLSGLAWAGAGVIMAGMLVAELGPYLLNRRDRLRLRQIEGYNLERS